MASWVWGECNKPRTAPVSQKQKLLLPEQGGYVVLKRISSNDGENPKRLFPAWLSRKTTGLTEVGLENHVQYIHRDNKPLSDSEGKRLIEFLQSEEAQAIMRSINGTTQINKADMAQLRLPMI